MSQSRVLKMYFNGGQELQPFLTGIRAEVIGVTGEIMTLDALINEIAKNIHMHAEGKGGLELEQKDDKVTFRIWDNGTLSHDFKACIGTSRRAGQGGPCGAGLPLIISLSESLKLENWKVTTTRGFHYSGTYMIGILGVGAKAT